MKKILFVNPAYKDDVMSNVLDMPPMGLATLAAYTPDSYEMKIVDENVSKLKFDIDVDLVAITSMTHNIPKAYDIAQKFRKRNITVIIVMLLWLKIRIKIILRLF